MPQKAHVRFLPLKTTLANLPLSIYSPLVQAQKRPQALALHVLPSHPGGKQSYLGWSGMSSSSVGGKDWLEVDPGVGASFGWKDGIEVEISIVHSLSPAKRISVAPLTPEDWEIISTNANYLEQNLLFHVRACALDQVLEVWIKGKNKIRMRVESTTPTPPPKSPALLLSQDTEIVISPLLRPPPPSPAPPAPKASSSTANPIAKSVAKTMPPKSGPPPTSLIVPPNSPILRVLPSRLIPAAPSPPPSPPADGPSSTSTPPPLTPPEAGPYALLSPASMTLLAPTSSSPTQSKAAPPQRRIVLLPIPSPSGTTAPDDGDQEQRPDKHVTLRVMEDPAIPFGHVVLHGEATSQIEEWDLVRAWESAEGVSVNPPKQVESQAEDGDGKKALAVAEVEDAQRVRLRSLPGLTKPFAKSVDFLMSSMVLQSGLFFSSASKSIDAVSRMLLLTGSAGSGKTTLAHALALRLEEDPRTLARMLPLSLPPLSLLPLATIHSTLSTIIARANHSRPSTIILDGLDALCGPEMEHVDTTRTRLIAEMLVSLFGPGARNGLKDGVVVIATAKGEAEVNPLLAGKHVFGDKVSLGGLDKEGRREVVEWLVNRKIASSPLTLDPHGRALNYIELAGRTEGYSVSDLGDLVDRAVQEAVLRSLATGEGQVLLGAEDFDSAQKGFVPLSLRDVKLHQSDVIWADIGGLHETRRVLRETLEWPTKYGAIFRQSPLRLRSGLLLYGYPGCGKTLLASAVAKECGLNFISVKGPEILNKYIGASEKSVRDLFERASAAKPCVLFFDEFDSIAPKRGHDSTGVTDRVVNQMLTQMDGAEGLEGVYVLAATSRPDLIDPALLRPGRLDRSLLCPLPSCTDRLEILTSLTHSLRLSPLVSLSDLASKTEHFSGADLGGLVGSAHLASVHASLDTPASASAPSESGDQDRVGGGGEVIVLGGEEGGSKEGTTRRTKAEEAALRKRVETMFGPGRKGRAKRHSNGGGGSAAPSVKTKTDTSSTTKEPPILILPSHFLSSLSSSRPSVPLLERARLGKIYADFVGVEDRSHGDGGLKSGEGAGRNVVGVRSSLG